MVQLSLMAPGQEEMWAIRKQVEAQGIESLYGRRKRGRQAVVTPRLHRRIFRAFDAGQQVGEVYATLMRSKNKADHVSYRSISRVRSEWLAQQSLSTEPETAGPAQGKDYSRCWNATSTRTVNTGSLPRTMDQWPLWQNCLRPSAIPNMSMEE